MDETQLKDIATKRGHALRRPQAGRACHRGAPPQEIDGQPARAIPVKVPRSTAGGGTEMVDRTLYVRNDLYPEETRGRWRPT
jgi:hypothetical protein